MGKWYLAVAVALTGMSATAEAQEMDWGPIIHAEAMGSAVAEAGREKRAGSQQRPPRAANDPLRRKCKAARAAAKVKTPPNWYSTLSKCLAAGY